MRIAITGGSGYLGSVLVPHLIHRAEVVDIIDLQPPSPAAAGQVDGIKCRYYCRDAADPRSMSRLVPTYDVIIHLAALVGYPACDKDPDLAFRCNVTTTRTLLQSLKPGARLLLASTTSNYGAQPGLVDEETPLNPTSIYGKTKQRAEQLTLQAGPHVVYRFAGAFGGSPRMRGDLLVHDFVRKAVLDGVISVYESHFVRQFIHVQDMARSIAFAVDNWSALAGRVFNVGNPEIEITKRDLVESIAKLVPFEARFESSGTDQERRNYPISFRRILDAGFRPRVTLETGLEELVRHYRLERDERRAPAKTTMASA